MRVTSAVLRQMGVPGPYSQTRPLEIAQLELEGPGPGEVLVQVAAAGLCHSDLSVINGSRPRPMPMALGHEGSGIVVDVGPGVTRTRPGDHVVFSFVPMCGKCVNCLSGQPYLCEPGQAANRAGTLLGGAIRWRDAKGQPVHHHLGVSTFSEYTVVNEASVVPIDPDLPLDKAALFGCAVITGVGAVVNTARVEPGSSVAIFGMGGVGLSAVMGARLSGAWPVIGVDILEDKLELARRAGATHIVNAKAPDWLEQIRDLTRGGVDYAFEAVGSSSVLADAYRSTRAGGTTVSIGLPHPDSHVSLPAVTFAGEGKRLIGSYMGSGVPVRDLPRFARLYQAGMLPIDHLVSATITLEQINEGFERLDRGEAARQVIQFPVG